MRTLNTLTKIALAAFFVVGLTACSKKKNGNSGTAAATPGSACVINGQSQYTYGGVIGGTPCSPTGINNQITCPPQGWYTNNQTGQQQQCTPGQLVSTTGYNYPGQYQYSQYMNTNYGCEQHYYTYGVQYVPVIINGQLQCMRYDLLNQPQYYQTPTGGMPYSQTPYYNNMDYYYAYPPTYYQNQNQSGFCLGMFGMNYCQYN